MVMWRVDDAQVRDAATGELLSGLVGAVVQIVQRDSTTPVAIFDAVGDPIAESKLVVTPVFTVPRFWVDTEDAAGLYLDWYHQPSEVRGPVEFEAVLRDAALAAAASASASETSAADSAAAAEAAAAAPSLELIEPLVEAAVASELDALPDLYAVTANATRDVGFGEPQHEDGAIYTYPTLLDFGPVNEPPPVVTPNVSRNLDIVAHWYNDFGLDKEALAAGQAQGAYLWYDWRWNFPTNTGDGETTYAYDPQRHPLQGFYKGDDPRVLGWQCKWLAEAGINAVSLVQTDGFKRVNGSGVDWSNPANAHYWVWRLFHEVPNFQALRWVAWMDSSGTAGDLATQLDELVWLWSNYPGGYTYTENGRTYPVFFLWDGELLRGALDNYNGATNTLVHLRSLSTKFKALGFDGVMVIARNAGVVSTNYDTYNLAADGVLYGYGNYSEMYSPPAGDSYNDDYAQYAAKSTWSTTARSVVGVQTAHDSVYPHPSNFLITGSTPEAFGLALRRAADHIVKHDKYRILTIGNVSEWAEQGPGLLPNVLDGFGYLDQVRSLPAYPATSVDPTKLVTEARTATFAKAGEWMVIRVAGITVPANGMISTNPLVQPQLTYLNNPNDYVFFATVSIESGTAAPAAPSHAIEVLVKNDFPSGRVIAYLYNQNAASLVVTVNIMIRKITVP